MKTVIHQKYASGYHDGLIEGKLQGRLDKQITIIKKVLDVYDSEWACRDAMEPLQDVILRCRKRIQEIERGEER